MSEIEKMYGNAGVKTDRVVCYRGFDNCIDNDFNCHCHNEKPCKDATKIYPSFTAEKQIELLKLLLFSTWWINLKRLQFAENFEQGLAELINDIWQDLTEEEKKQIRNILEG